MVNLTGNVVKPNHKGQDGNGNVIDWTVFRGRATEYVPPLSEYDKQVGGHYIVVWFKDAKYAIGKWSKYPAVDLSLA